MRLGVWIFVGAAVAMSVPSLSMAQALVSDARQDAIARLLPGHGIAVRTGKGTIAGDFVTNRSDSLLLRTRDDRIALPYEEVLALHVRTNSRPGGMLVGFLAGSLAIGYLEVANGETGGTGLGALAGGILGSFFGGILGSAVPHWKRVYPPIPGPKEGGGPPSAALSNLSIAARFAYASSPQENGNQGGGGTLTVLGRNSHRLALGGEVGYYPFPNNASEPSEGLALAGGHTIEINIKARLRPAYGRVRPTLSAGLGPYLDHRRFIISDTFGASSFTNDKIDMGIHAGPGVQLGSDAWSLSVEGAWHEITGRAPYSNLLTLAAGVTWR